MRAAVYTRTGPASEVLQIRDRQVPIPGVGEVLVRVRGSGINPADVKRRAGWRGSEMVHPVIIPHCDGAGEIVAIGADVKSRAIDDRVWIWNAQGGYDGPGRAFGTAAEFIAIPAEQTALLNDELSFLEGACLGVPAMTAQYAVFSDAPIAGKTVLVQGGGGVVAHLAIQFASYYGARVIATAGSDARANHARAAGAIEVFNRHDPNMTSAIMEWTNGEGVDRIIELEFGGNLQSDATLLRARGVIAAYSSSQIPEPVFPYYQIASKGGVIRIIQSFGFSDEIRRDVIASVNKLVAKQKLNISIGKAYPIEEIANAHVDVETEKIIGNVVLEI